MSVLSFTPHLHTHINPKRTPKPKTKPLKTRRSLQIVTAFSDPFVLQLAETLEDSLPSSSSLPSPLQKLRDLSSQTLLSAPWPSRKDEAFRFIDTSFIKNSQIEPISCPSQSSTSLVVSDDIQFPNFVFVDGFIQNSLSNLSNLPDGVYVGSLLGASDSIMTGVCDFVGDFQLGDLFWSINGMGTPDLGVIYVPAGCRVENPIHLRYLSIDGGNEVSKKLPVSNPRVFVLVEEGGEVGIVEEFVGKEGNEYYWANSVFEAVIGKGGIVRHSYVQRQSQGAAHIKWTSVRQVNFCS